MRFVSGFNYLNPYIDASFTKQTALKIQSNIKFTEHNKLKPVFYFGFVFYLQLLCFQYSFKLSGTLLFTVWIWNQKCVFYRFFFT